MLLSARSRSGEPSWLVTWRVTTTWNPSRAVSTGTTRPQGRFGSGSTSGVVSGVTRLVIWAGSTWTFQFGLLPYSENVTASAVVDDWMSTKSLVVLVHWKSSPASSST